MREPNSLITVSEIKWPICVYVHRCLCVGSGLESAERYAIQKIELIEFSMVRNNRSDIGERFKKDN